ncbi:hypothetical protein N2605_04790 [Bradyrhizobium yuanmingense]|uniref:hypothetical protein n=1 Tax=Bradyrhizobium yuanmingense TaxID=108015 RepID=UPI0021A7B53B|nr:hypothetical protein [Bradyrhizobium sp. CB1024]UWU85784.1 hypothetical protein N2605_04790 [Bradyrhizobium sp. CB1024]
MSSAANRILRDDKFKSGILANLPTMQDFSADRPTVLATLARATAIIKLRDSEESLQRAATASGDRELAAADDAVRFSLTRNPADALLWLWLFRLDNDRKGYEHSHLAFLERSYAAGPREGWISLRRNRMALMVFDQLSENIQNTIVAEYAGMVDAGFFRTAALNLAGPGWVTKDRLLAGLAQVDLASRQALSRQFSREGVQITVPGVPEEEYRPWR